MPAPPPRRRPPGRYDEPSRTTTRLLTVLLAALMAAFVATVVLGLYLRFGDDEFRLQVRGFDVQGEAAVVVQFAVTPPAGQTVWCLVRARNAAGLEVGRVFVPVRGGGSAVRVDQRLPTTDRAVTGEVPRCSTSAPPSDVATADPVGP